MWSVLQISSTLSFCSVPMLLQTTFYQFFCITLELISPANFHEYTKSNATIFINGPSIHQCYIYILRDSVGHLLVHLLYLCQVLSCPKQCISCNEALVNHLTAESYHCILLISMFILFNIFILNSSRFTCKANRVDLWG